MIKKLLGLVFNRWVLLALLLLALALVIYLIGPLIAIADYHPLDSEAARWITIGAMFAFVGLVLLYRTWRARRGNQQVVNQLTAAPAGETESADMIAVRERFEKALATLKRARFGSGQLLSGWKARLDGRYLYELPWYLIIGAPGSGKTTALQNCGLTFPLAQSVGDHAVKGVGGTRNCDWWFTDRAVLIDTAGRFTTQDSDRENDRATWSGFLKLLRRSRPRQPVNGVLVTVSITDLLTRSTEERARHAATVRERVQELHQDLGIRFPIYLLVTKCDLLAGFMDYFATLDKDQRATPWGYTFPLPEEVKGKPGATPLISFLPEFDALQRRLDDGLIDRLQSERDPQRRTRIYGFPGQFAGLRTVLAEFAEAVFAPSPYETDPLLRGVYFISGTQEGTPIDRVLGAVARGYGLERAIIAPNQSSGRSYFLNRLLGEVVFSESALGGTNRRWERRRRVLALSGYALVGLSAAGLLTAWTVSYLGNRRYVDEVAVRVDQVRKLVQATPNRATPDLQPLLPALDATRLFANPAGDGSAPWQLGFGLYQGEKLTSAARSAYDRMLVDAVLPRLAFRVEEQLRQEGETADRQYEALKAYVMMHDPERFNAEALKAYVEADWDANFGRQLSAEDRALYSSHLDALLAQGAAVSPVPKDQALIDGHRARLAAVTLPQRIYSRLRHQGFGSDFPEFTVLRAAGSQASLVFARKSGAPLGKGVPGIYSYDGYHRGFQREVARAAEELADEQSWVLGIADPVKDAAAKVRANAPLVDDVRRLYLMDYANAWEAFIADIVLLPLTSLGQAVQMARLLSAPDSPLPPLLRAMSRETTLTATTGKNVVEKAEAQATGALKTTRERLAGMLTQKPVTSGPPVESLVDDRFKSLRHMVTKPDGGKPPIDDTIALIGEVHVLLNAVETAVRGGAAPPPSPLPNRVESVAQQQPEPLRTMLHTLSENSAKVSQILVRQNLGQEVRSQIGEFCEQAVAGRYPINRASKRDATQADFALLFGAGGKFDTMFQQKLAPYVDTTTRPWSFRAVEGTPLGTDRGQLMQFQRAQTIKETLFPTGNQPSLRLDFKPVEMDGTLTQFVLDVDGQVVRYAHGPQIPTSVQWPGPRGSAQVRVQLSPPSTSGMPSGMVEDGPWALFRLFDAVRIEPTAAPERFIATFDIGGRKAVFEVTTSSVRNPFRMPELREFSCPTGL